MKKLLMALLLGAALAHGEKVKGTGKSVDVTKFDVRGIKLGMSEKEALKIIKEKFPAGKIETLELPVDDWEIPIYGKKAITYQIYVVDKNEKNSEFSLLFVPNFLGNNPKELVVSGISYHLPENKDNVKELRRAAVEKYGQPVVVDPKHGYTWCDLAGKKDCAIYEKPFLSVYSLGKRVYLSLSNIEYHEARNRAQEKAEKATKIEL